MNVESRSVYAKFYEDIINVGHEIVEIRISNLEKNYMVSKYIKNLNELLKIFKTYNKYPFNIYYGINSRTREGRKKEDIDYRHVFYLDIEKDGEKPSIEKDSNYKKELEETTTYLCKKIYEKYKLKPCALIQSGRGYHLYYKHEKLKRIEYETKFASWWKKDLIPYLDKNKPHKEIKFKDSMFNISRISSAPGTNHNKYKDRPFRKILKYNNVESKISNILDGIQEKKYNIKKITISKKNLLSHPVFKILKKGVPMNEGFYVNNVLMFSASLICRDAGLNEDEIKLIEEKLVSWGYWEGSIILPGPEYSYNKITLNNWCFNNIDWCIKNNFKLPYEFFKNKIKYETSDDEKAFEDKQINNINELLKYVDSFNSKYYKINKGVKIIYKKSLLEKLEKNCVENLKEFLTFNNLWHKICVYNKSIEIIL